MPKRSPIGYSDFKEIVDQDLYYVDKTALVRPIVDGAKVQLHCRPRRFGKTLNLSTLRYFFDCEGDYGHLFEGLTVAQDKEMTARHQGKYPVIQFSFKDLKASDYESAIKSMARLLYEEWLRHACLVGTPEYDRRMELMTRNIEAGEIREDLFEDAIKKLSNFLHAHFGSPVVLLIDEYDTPLQRAWLNGYYDKMTDFMRPLFGAGLKDNPHLFKGVLTGILRVAKESLFSGLNNFVSDAGLKAGPHADKFGFTEGEVDELLAHYGLNGRERDAIREWYDGYRYGGVAVYNPWSILRYIAEGEPDPSPHWVNTGGHDLLKRLFFGQGADIKKQLEVFMRGESLFAHVDEFLTFRGLETSPDAILSLMYFAGYLRVGEQKKVEYLTHHELSIPNREVWLAYRDTLTAWFREDLGGTFGDPLLEALTTGDILSFGERLSSFVLRVASFYDTSEDRTEHFYHAFLLGLLARLDSVYHIRSNRESGLGRYDISLLPKELSRKGIVMEIKSSRPTRGETLAGCLALAKTQLLSRKYDTDISAAGVTDILRLAIAVEGKEVVVEEVVG